jgi:hypothetical protein
MHKRFDEDRLRCEVVSDTAPKPSDTLSRRGAMGLARRLEKYWHNKGYPAARFFGPSRSMSASRRSAPTKFIASRAIS